MIVYYQDRLVDRSEVPIDMEDRGYQFGDGVYEVIRIYRGQCFALDPHLNRLKRSAAALRISLPCSENDLKQKLPELVRENNMTEGILYLQITRGAAPRAHSFPEEARPVLTAYTSSLTRPKTQMQDGVSTVTTEDIRWLRCDIKSINLLGNVLAKQEAVEADCEEAVFIRDGMVTEGSATNIFRVHNGKIQTHPANHLILNGITRTLLLEQANLAGIPYVEQPFTKDELLESDEVFITSTTKEIVPVIEIDRRDVGQGKPGPITRQLQNLFEELIH